MGLKKLISRMMLGKIVYKVQSEKSFKQTLEDLQKQVAEHGFTVTHIHDIKNAFEKNGLKTSKDFEHRIVQFCNPQKAYNVMSMSTDAGIMMPKSISVLSDKDGVYLQFMKMKPFMVALMFPDINLAPMSKKVMGTMTNIAEKSAR